MRTLSAITIAAVSAALAAPPALPQFQGFDTDFSAVEAELSVSVDLLAALGDEVDEALLGDLALTLDIETITDDGLRLGAVLGFRAQQHGGRRALGALAGNCPAGAADCAALGGVAARGLTGGFYTDGLAEDIGSRSGLETGYVYARSGLGEVRIGYGPGAAALDGEAAESAFRLSRADGALVDPTGLAGARTLNAASGFAPKLFVRSAAFGQTSTIGTLRAAASWTPDAEGCGVDVCLYEPGAGGPLAPQLGAVYELAAEYEISRGLNVFTVNLGAARGDVSTLAGADDLEANNASLGWRREAWAGRLAWLRSNNGVIDGDYEAWSATLSYEAGDWLTAIELARFSDDFAHVDGTGLQLGSSRLLGESWILGGGLRYDERDAPVLTPQGRRSTGDEAASAFLELGWRF
jgi:hypothetical protein